jgi:hypothetical protein
VCNAHDARALSDVSRRAVPLQASGAAFPFPSFTILMSRAFLRDDAEGEMPRRNYNLPDREDPTYDWVAANAMLEAARVGETQLAERATGYYWGEAVLRPYVEEILAKAEAEGDDRLEQLARRFLR